MEPIPVGVVPFPAFALPTAQIVPVFVALVFIVWALFTIVASYHWIRYSESLTVALGALGMHLIVSSMLAIYAVSGFA